MLRGLCWFLTIGLIAGPLSPRGPFASLPAETSISVPVARATNDKDWQTLLKSDPLHAISITLEHYRQNVRGFTATLVKQERLGKTLHPVETITLAVREQPFAVSMTWQSGMRNQTQATLFVRGENGGDMRVWRPSALLGKTMTVSPTNAIPRSASRYSITESSLMHGQMRTVLAWQKAQDKGQLDVTYEGPKPVPELGGQICHVLKRRCADPEHDPFVMGETAKPKPTEMFRTVKIYLDLKHGYQVGAELLRDDGERVGAYFFKDLKINPPFAEGQFTEAAWK